MVEKDLEFGILSARQKAGSDRESQSNKRDELDKPRSINSQAHRKFTDYMFSIIETADLYEKEH